MPPGEDLAPSSAPSRAQPLLVGRSALRIHNAVRASGPSVANSARAAESVARGFLFVRTRSDGLGPAAENTRASSRREESLNAA